MITQFKNPHRVLVLTERDSAELLLSLNDAIKLVNIELDKLAATLAESDSVTVEYKTAADATGDLVRRRSHLHNLLTAIL